MLPNDKMNDIEFLFSSDGIEIRNQKDVVENYLFHQELHNYHLKRTQTITEILSNYTSQQKERYIYKKDNKPVIFWILTSIMLLLTLGIIAWVVLALVLVELNTQAVIAIIGSLVTYLGSLISILIVIVNYLFPADEEKNFNNLVSTIVQNDTDIIKIENEYELKRNKRSDN